jgi:4-diphosphocytidyl-2-C-methyl-D-erythritol kinase
MTALIARAKLTWYLEITGVRADGFHELRSEMVTLDFADRLEVEPDEDYLRLTTPDASIPLDGTNLVSRALQLVGRRAGVTIDKHIPSGGGLGGGSADAAAILRWAGGVSGVQALSLGGDVPFCQLGGRALVEGVGELLTPLAYEERKVTLMMPDFKVDTAACYRAYDELASGGSKPTGWNHLEPAARLVQPQLGRTLDWLRAEYSSAVHLAGSGSTMFLEGHLDVDRDVWDVAGPNCTLRFRQTTTTPQEAL